MLGQCPICLETLVGAIEPVAMPCGHLYCLDCATFWFNAGQGPQSCSMCRRGFRGEDIIKLWLTSASEGSSQRNTEREAVWSEAGGRGQEVLEACEEALMNVDVPEGDAALANAMLKTEAFLDNLATESGNAAPPNMLKTIRTVLSDIHKALERKAQPPPKEVTSSATAPGATREIKQMRAKMDNDIQEMVRDEQRAEVARARVQHDHERREQELRDRLQDVRRNLEIARRTLESTQTQVLQLSDQLKRAQKYELRYKKKYYALKQDVAAARRRAGGNNPGDDDDSLMVI